MALIGPIVLLIATRKATGGAEPGLAPSVVGGGPFREVPTDVEQPEIRVRNETGMEGGSLIFRAAGREWTLNIVQGQQSLSLDPGEYRYELRGPYYARTGLPDQQGALTCRKFRRYELFVALQNGVQPGGDVNLGD